MAIENIQEIIDYMDTNKENEDVKSYVGGLNPMTADRTNEFLNTEDGKKFLQPKLDTYADKSYKTKHDNFMTNDLTGLIDAEVNKRYPQKDQKDIDFANYKAEQELKTKALEDKFNASESKSLRESLVNKNLKLAQESKLSASLAKYSDLFIGADEESTTKLMNEFLADVAKHDEIVKLAFGKENAFTPPGGKKDVSGLDKIREEIRKNMHA